MDCDCGSSCPYVTKAKQAPFIDTFGPFHDETILSGVDKMLYFLGKPNMMSPSWPNIGTVIQNKISEMAIKGIAKKLSSHSIASIGTLLHGHMVGDHMSESCSTKSSKRNEGSFIDLLQDMDGIGASRKHENSPNIGELLHEHMTGSCPSRINECKKEKFDTCSTSKSTSVSHLPSVRFIEDIKSIICPKCGGQKVKDKVNKACLAKKREVPSPCRRPKKPSINRSFSLCSLACRKLKEKFSSNTKNKNSQWLWARKRNECQHQIYEIFQSPDPKICPKHAQLNKYPKMILIVTPCGMVFPFETVKCHF